MKYNIHQVDVTASTNDDAKRAAEAGEGEGLVIWALRQTAGRGRYGRQWDSPEGNLYCSVLLRPDVAGEKCPPLSIGERGSTRVRQGVREDYGLRIPCPSSPHSSLLPEAGEELYHCSAMAQAFIKPTLGHFSFVASLAQHDTIRDFLPQTNVTLKWPNDVLVNGKKIGGILLESSDGWLVVGIGLNVAHYPEDVLYPATSLQAEGLRQADLPQTLDALLNHLSRWYETLKRGGFTPVRAAWLERAQKGSVTVRMPDRTVEGVFIGLDDNGSLRLRLPDGSENSIATGDVFFAQEPHASHS